MSTLIQHFADLQRLVEPATMGDPERAGASAEVKVECALDERTFEKGIRISKAEMSKFALEGDAFHPEGNYKIKPRS